MTENICKEKSKSNGKGNGKGKKSDTAKADTNVVSNNKKKQKPDPLIARLDAQAKAQAAQAAQIEKLTASVSNLTGILTGSENVGGNLAQVANLNLANLLNIGRNAGPVPSSNANATVGSGGSCPSQSGYGGQGFRGNASFRGMGGNRGQGSNRGRSNNPVQQDARNLNRSSGFCELCVAANARYCNHCLLCGSTEHILKDCPVLANDEKNVEKL